MNHRTNIHIAILFAILAALFYGISIPIAKILLNHLSPYLLSSLLYFGAGIGMLSLVLFSKRNSLNRTWTFGSKDRIYIILMIVLDIIAPILLMFGLLNTASANASLLNNLEIVFTTVIAMIFFKEVIGKKMWFAIGLLMIAGVLLSFDDISSIHFSVGSILVILATLSWGLENNCTRMLSHHNPIHVVVIKGIGSGTGALIIALAFQEPFRLWYIILLGLLLGFVSYGLSLYFYISAQRTLGASRTSAYYATAPFIGAILSFLLLQEQIDVVFVIAFIFMVLGTYFVIKENNDNKKST